MIKKIIVIFKTHLDVGFTGFAKDITQNYLEHYLPNAMRVAKQMRGEKEGFIWTVGSWLIEKYMEEGKHPELLEEAIEHGEIRWHGLPFTTHTELMDDAIFQYGLGISKKLDQKFYKNTIAAKMTDVPGHTKSMIPALHHAGIRFLHLGKNSASTGPKVPDLFKWRADSGEEILVMYHDTYGQMAKIGNSSTAVYFAHTGDNLGPQSPEEIREIYRELHKAYPEAELCAGTLEDLAKEALKEKNLPIITDELGDTWIHGSATDPGKISQFRALLRLKDQLSPASMERIYKEILLVPEHTWGLDEKTCLGEMRNNEPYGEYRFFVRKEFEEVKSTDKFRKMELSWQEQRDYITNAVNILSGNEKHLAKEAISQYRRTPTDTTSWQERKPGETLHFSGYQVCINNSGAIYELTKDGCVLADSAHPIGQFMYEVFSQQEYDRFQKQYLVHREQWALEDFGKTGVDRAISAQKTFLPTVKQIYSKEQHLVICMELPKEATDLYGGMEQLEMHIEFLSESVLFDFAWFGKKSSRVPEAAWLQFAPEDRICKIQKMGQWIDPSKVIENGNRHMHAVNTGINMEHMQFITLDAPLISLGKPWLLNFTNEAPDLEHGVWVNLINNVWGTNFPMWYEENARFRFVLKTKFPV